ncbi:MAG: hypothetical protein ACR2PO_03070 [Methyloligellaceae bacterium]
MNRASRLTAAAAIFVGLVLISPVSVLVAAAQSPNDTARYLAGLPPSGASPLARFTRHPAWIRHAAILDQAWQRLQKNQLTRIRAWSRQHLPGYRQLMLYMFSGPDFLYADAFFPNASTYVLTALEPVGPRPNVTRLSRGARALALQELRGSMQSVLTFSFFITKEMKTDLSTGTLRGALPVLYVFLARSGKTIHRVEFVNLRSDGTVNPRAERASKRSSPGVKIVFSGSDGRQRTLYYFRTDLSNGGLKGSGLRKFCRALGSADSLIKSASFLLHGRSFSLAREFLLEHSAAIVQDDSAIPVRYFDQTKWALFPFGQYLGPIEIFAQHYQPRMQRLFAKPRAVAIDFGIGYRWRRNRTNVLLAIKRAAPAPR